MSWVALLGKEVSDEQVAGYRRAAVEQWGELKWTCDDCFARRTCEFVFDPYNTDGDCLAEK